LPFLAFSVMRVWKGKQKRRANNKAKKQSYLYHTALCYFVDTISWSRLWKTPMGQRRCR
jgi:hypothetical protein